MTHDQMVRACQSKSYLWAGIGMCHFSHNLVFELDEAKQGEPGHQNTASEDQGYFLPCLLRWRHTSLKLEKANSLYMCL